MNVLLINPNREQMPWPAVPVGLCTVATSARRAGHDVELLDLTFSRELARDLATALRRRAPDLVGITVRNIDNCNFESPVFYLEEIRDQVVRLVRTLLPSAKIVIGGSAVNVSPSDVFDYLGADFAIVGEGEDALPALASALENRQPLDAVPGLLAPGTRSQRALPVLDTGRLLEGEPKHGRAVVRDLACAARSEAWRWVDLRQYAARGGPYSVQTKRGCALKCSYCVYNNIEGHAYRLRNPVEVVDEIAEAKQHGVRQVDFVDSTFNLPLSHARSLCDELASRALGVELSTMGLNPAGLSAGLVLEMKRAGFRSVMCTPESASEITLQSLHKGFGKSTVIRAAEALREADIPSYWFFMFGAPGETIETVKETLEFCERYIPRNHMVLFSTGIRVYAGTPLERSCKQMGWFDEDESLFQPSWFLSPEIDLQELYALLVGAAATHPNWMTNAETMLSPRMATLMKRAFRMMGWKGPFWQHLPKLFRLATRLGMRQRGLAAVQQNLRRMADLPHHH
jgi:anaerobic magnesium-protoporphyrin IX monomethyl ester cyclase